MPDFEMSYFVTLNFRLAISISMTSCYIDIVVFTEYRKLEALVEISLKIYLSFREKISPKRQNVTCG